MSIPATDASRVQMELLRPHEIQAILDHTSTVYIPLGSIEWHCEHLPVGLDGLTAHGVCLRAALVGGGLVYPPLYFGTGGGHSDYPWTVMMADETEIRALLEHLLHRLERFGVAKAVLFSGHFAPGQLDMIANIAAAWNASHSPMTVVARGINMAEGLAIAPDHAGIFETTMLYALWPDRVDLERLPALDDAHPMTDDFEDSRHDPNHPIWGVFGPDPRNFDPSAAPALLADVALWLVAQ
jgi:creatinine amidohydrolase